MTSTELAKLDEQSLIRRMEQARWTAALAPQDRRALAEIGALYGLDPIMSELILYEGKPYITLAGMIRKAHDAKGFEGVEDRPMTEDERKAYGIKQPVAWIAKVYRRGFRVPTVGTGGADPVNPLRSNAAAGKPGNPIERENPQIMARSRAIRQALRLAFPHSLPFAELPSAEERGIDLETGEILEGQVTVVETPGEDSYEDKPGIDEEGFDSPAHSTGDLAPGELTASALPEAHEEAAAKEDGIRKLKSLAAQKGKEVVGWFAFTFGHPLEQGSVDELVDAIDKVSRWPDFKPGAKGHK